MFLPHVNVIQRAIDDGYVQIFFEKSFKYICLIAINTCVLIVLVEPEFLPAYFLLELVLEICTSEIFVHVFVHETCVSLLEMHLRLVI